MLFLKLVATLGLLRLTTGVPTAAIVAESDLENATDPVLDPELSLEPGDFSLDVGVDAIASCATRVQGLNQADCQYIKKLGFVAQGRNSGKNDGPAWIGSNGANTFKFTNRAGGVPVTLVLWTRNNKDDYEAMFPGVRRPQITYSLPNPGSSVTVSIKNGVSGAWAALNNHKTTLNAYGLIKNTWGEFTTGAYATVDVSREVWMDGNVMAVTVARNGCVSNMGRCSFHCKNGAKTCGDKGTYELVNCAPGSQPGANYGLDNGAPSGGCSGWSGGGHLDITLGRY